MVNTVWPSVNQQPCKHVCALWCVCIERCEKGKRSPMVCGLWLIGMSGTCVCFPDCAIHMCASVNQHKAHLPRMPTLCCRCQFGDHEDLVTCHHALVGCLVTTPSQVPFQSLFSTPLFSLTILSCSVPLAFTTHLETIFWPNLMACARVLSSVFPSCGCLW